MILFGREFKFNGFDVIHKGDLIVWEGVPSEPDENGFTTVIDYKRGDGRKYLQIRFLNPVDGVYQNYSLTYYENDGITVKSEYTYDIALGEGSV